MFNRTKMMDEALVSKKRMPITELFIFFLLYIISNFLSYFLFVPPLLKYLLSDAKILELITAAENNVEAVATRTYELLEIMPEWLIIYRMFASIATVVTVIVFCKCVEKRKISSMGIRKKNAFREVGFGVILGIAMLGTMLTLLILTGTVKFEGISNFSISIVLLYLFGSIIIGLADELLYRGCYMINLTKLSSVKYSLIISSLIYAIVKSYFFGGSFLTFINLLIFGLTLGILVIKRGSIWLAAVLRGVWEFTQIAFFGAAKDSTHIFNLSVNTDMSNLHGGELGLIGGLIVTLVFFLMIGFVIKLKPDADEVSDKEIAKEKNEGAL